MTITDEKKLADIQKEFQEHFPHLNIKFYHVQHEEGSGSPDSQLIDPSLSIGAVRTIHNTGDLSINGHQKVSTLESAFTQIYGLNAQVFRRSGNLWLQTIRTDDWTLAEQNKKGAASIQSMSS